MIRVCFALQGCVVMVLTFVVVFHALSKKRCAME